MLVDELVHRHWKIGVSAQSGLVKMGHQDRREQPDRGQPGIGRAHFTVFHMRLQAARYGGDDGLKVMAEIGSTNRLVGKPFPKPDDLQRQNSAFKA